MRDQVSRRVRLGMVLALIAAVALPLGAAADPKPGKPSGSSAAPPDPNSDNFCKFEGTDGTGAFQCEVKGRYALGTPCICPGKGPMGKITHR